MPYLTAPLRQLEFDFLKRLSGKNTKEPRWIECVKTTSNMFILSLSSMYIRDYFKDKTIRDDVNEIFVEIASEFEKILHSTEWMDQTTKKEALEKLKTMGHNIAYPPELLNQTLLEKYYENLHLNDTNYLQSAMNIDRHGKIFICSRYHQPVNRKDWIDHATTIYVNANYNGKGNSVRKFSFELFLY